MSWNIRVMKHNDTPAWYALHEVYYNDDGKIMFWDVDPVEMKGDTRHELFSYLIMCLKDMWRCRHDVLDYEMEPEARA